MAIKKVDTQQEMSDKKRRREDNVWKQVSR